MTAPLDWAMNKDNIIFLGEVLFGTTTQSCAQIFRQAGFHPCLKELANHRSVTSRPVDQRMRSWRIGCGSSDLCSKEPFCQQPAALT